MAKHLFLLLLVTAVFVHAELPETPQTGHAPSDFKQMYDANDTYNAGFKTFDWEQWNTYGTVDIKATPTLRIKIGNNVFLKTMAIVNLHADSLSTGFMAVDKILFGLEIRFEGF